MRARKMEKGACTVNNSAEGWEKNLSWWSFCHRSPVSSEPQQAEVITYRNNLNKIALTPYNRRDPWEIDATRIGATVYLGKPISRNLSCLQVRVIFSWRWTCGGQKGSQKMNSRRLTTDQSIDARSSSFSIPSCSIVSLRKDGNKLSPRVIFVLCGLKDTRMLDMQPMNDRQRRFMYYGYNFEDICTSDGKFWIDRF